MILGELMRFYGFGNYYLSSLQQGLQAAHLVGELFTQYDLSSSQYDLVKDWGTNHKTMVLLNGGNSANLQALFELFQKFAREGMPLPFANFHEDEQSLGGALTYVGIVIPEKYYNAAFSIRKMNPAESLHFFNEQNFKEWEIELVCELNNYKLAS
jgi:hypothetical protein